MKKKKALKPRDCWLRGYSYYSATAYMAEQELGPKSPRCSLSVTEMDIRDAVALAAWLQKFIAWAETKEKRKERTK